MFRRMTPPRHKVERSDSGRSNSSTAGGMDYTENGPELENAITNKNWSLVRKLVAQNFGTARKHLLHKAVRNGAPVEIVEILIEKGCLVDETQEGNWTPLHVAAKYDATPAVVEQLIKAGAHLDTRTTSGETALFFSIERDSDTVVDLLIKAGADVNMARPSDGMTPLMILMHVHAAPNQSTPWVFDVLVKAGADVNAAANDGMTPLLIALQKGCSTSLLESLLKAGADANKAKKTGETPLFVVAQNDMSPTLAELLIKAGADVNRGNQNGETPISIAAQRNAHLSMMEVLIKAGGDVNKPSISGLTPALGAVLEGASKQLVSLMLAHGADIKTTRFQRKTPAEVATDRGFTHLVPLLDPSHTHPRADFVKADFSFNFCTTCRKTGVELSPCSACGLVAYCSSECRTRHYKVGGHADVCKAVMNKLGDEEDEE